MNNDEVRKVWRKTSIVSSALNMIRAYGLLFDMFLILKCIKEF